jgi:peptidoglycan/xylan/chitin deacetylase (PgdA/CDA1 family)
MNIVINFHNITDITWFKSVITFLKKKYIIISIEELEDYFYGMNNLKNACHITFDDGDLTFYEVAYPILKQQNIPASLYVSPKICKLKENFWFQEIRDYNEEEIKKLIYHYTLINTSVLKKFPMTSAIKCLNIELIWKIIQSYQEKFHIAKKKPLNINIDQLIEIDREGLVKIGAHTENHPILANEDYETCEREITTSFDNLKGILGHEIKYFAYPNGIPKYDFGQREIEILKKNNCRIAFSANPDNFTKLNNPLSINRYSLSHGNMLFISSKLLLKENWDKIKNLFRKSEIQTRIELNRKLISFKIQKGIE